MSHARDEMIQRLRGQKAEPVATRRAHDVVPGARERMLRRNRGEKVDAEPEGEVCGPICKCLAQGTCTEIPDDYSACMRPAFADGQYVVIDALSPFPGRLSRTCAGRGCTHA